jgi:hypothetical protein
MHMIPCLEIAGLAWMAMKSAMSLVITISRYLTSMV